ncbi:MAG: hypothetical protein AAGG02_09455 [Cyanobacteria bacterium P01_H01_bin.15]
MRKQHFYGSALVITTLVMTAVPVQAQVDYDPQQQDPFPSGDVDANTGTLDGIDPFELIHRSRLNNGRSATEFREDSNQKLDDAALDFKRQQQERLENPSSPESVTP